MGEVQSASLIVHLFVQQSTEFMYDVPNNWIIVISVIDPCYNQRAMVTALFLSLMDLKKPLGPIRD